MKKIILLVTLLILSSAYSYDDHEIDSEVEIEGFIVGSDGNLGGAFVYTIDRTNNLCFASMAMSGPNAGGGGLVQIPCDKLKKTKSLKRYIETGKVKK